MKSVFHKSIFAEGSCLNATRLNGSWPIKYLLDGFKLIKYGSHPLDYKLPAHSEPAGMGLVQKYVMVVNNTWALQKCWGVLVDFGHPI